MVRLKWLWQYTNDEGGSPTGRGKLFTNRKPDNNGSYRVKARLRWFLQMVV